MKVSALAEELELEPSVLLRMCRDRGIRASWEESELSDEAVASLREAVRPADPEHPAEPHHAEANPAFVASLDHLPAPELPDSASTGAAAAPAAAASVALAEPSAAPASGEAAPEFGTIDPRYASVAAAMPEHHENGDEARRRPPYTPELATGVKSLVFAAVLFLGWVLSRLLPHWNRGHWWLLASGCAVLAAAGAVRALFVGVHGVTEVVRFPKARRGKVECGAVVLVAAALLLSGTLLGFYDWTAIRVPDDYTRLKDSITHTQRQRSSQLNQLQGVSLSTTISAEGTLPTGLNPGDCIEVTIGDNLTDDLVSCETFHHYEVAGSAPLGSGAFPGTKAVKSTASTGCTLVYTSYVGDPPSQSHYLLLATYPTAQEWAAGGRESLCLVETPEDFTSPLRGTRK